MHLYQVHYLLFVTLSMLEISNEFLYFADFYKKNRVLFTMLIIDKCVYPRRNNVEVSLVLVILLPSHFQIRSLELLLAWLFFLSFSLIFSHTVDILTTALPLLLPPLLLALYSLKLTRINSTQIHALWFLYLHLTSSLMFIFLF